MPDDRSIRLFAAVYPAPGEAQAMLGLAAESLSGMYRPTPLEQVHVTLHFIGDTRPADLDSVTESVGRAVAGLPPITLRPVRLRSLPERGWPRLIALETDAPSAVVELHRRLVARLARAPRGRDRDAFLPHFTLARYPHDARPDRLDRPVAMDPVRIGEVRLVRSRLRAGGAEHQTVAAWPLTG